MIYINDTLREPIRRDNEGAYVSVNGKTCWSKNNLVGTIGTQQCGGLFFKEEMFRVTGCYVTLSGSEATLPLTVSAWTTLDGDAADESFGIDNVFIEQGIAIGLQEWLGAPVYIHAYVTTCTRIWLHRTRIHTYYTPHTIFINKCTYVALDPVPTSVASTVPPTEGAGLI